MIMKVDQNEYYIVTLDIIIFCLHIEMHGHMFHFSDVTYVTPCVMPALYIV